MVTFSLIAALTGALAQTATPSPATESFVTTLPQGECAVLENGVYHDPSVELGKREGNVFVTMPERIRRKVEEEKPRFLHDSIVTHYVDGENNLKEVYTYDSDFHPLEKNRYSWNRIAKEWSYLGNITCTWDNNLMTSIVETYLNGNGLGGSRNDFYYDGDGDNNEIIFSKYENDEWVPKQRGLYSYDENHFVTEVITQNMGPDGQWVNETKDCAEYTPTGLRTLYESYRWDGKSWYSTSYRNVYEFNEDGLMISKYTYSANGNGWENQSRILQEWDGDKLTMQSYEFWNKEREDWLGSIENPSLYTTLEYNEHGYKTMEKGYIYDFDLNEWKLNVYFESIFTPTENGGFHEMMTNYSMQYDIVTETVEREYDRFGNNLFYKQVVRSAVDAPMLPLIERYWNYDETGKLLLEEGTYQFSGEEKVAYAKITYEYDSEGGMTVQYGYMGKYLMTGQGELDEWINFSRKDFAYKDGVKQKELCYYWRNDNYEPQYGEENDFNFDVLTSECVYWIDNMPDIDYMLTERRFYNADGMGGWMVENAKWYYSEVEVNGINDMEAVKTVKVYPNPASDFISVDASEGSLVEIYSMSGAKVISTTSHFIDITGLSQGIYIVNADGHNSKLIKK